MMTDTLRDEGAIIRDAQRGDRAAFGQLVRNYQQMAYATAYGFVRNREDALELAQDSFVKAYRAMGRFDTNMPFYPWFHRIVKNTCLNHIKKRNRRGETSLDGLRDAGVQFATAKGGPEHYAGLDEIRAHLAEAMDALSDDHREIVTLRHIHDMSYAEIAACLDIPKGTVMSRLHAARRRMRELILEASETAG
jgi:RNA polymerase sigma-70 factor (ECF subfamily)